MVQLTKVGPVTAAFPSLGTQPNLNYYETQISVLKTMRNLTNNYKPTMSYTPTSGDFI